MRNAHCIGSVFIEMTLTLPLLLVLGGATAELSHLLQFRMKTSRIAYEGLRQAASTTGLSQEMDPDGPLKSSVVTAVTELLTLEKHIHLSDEAIPVVLEYDEETNVVSLTVRVSVDSLFGLWNSGTEVVIRSEAPYLYPARDE